MNNSLLIVRWLNIFDTQNVYLFKIGDKLYDRILEEKHLLTHSVNVEYDRIFP